jgi:hypothetical protein
MFYPMLQIIYDFCSILLHCTHLAINPVLFFFYQIHFSLQNKMILADQECMAAAVCIIIILGAITHPLQR